MRREFTKKIMRDAALRANGSCEDCTRKLMAGDYHYDHRVPDAMGGEPTLENCQVLCKACHHVKTRTTDVPDIAKAKRRERGRFGIPSRKGPPMPGSKASGWKHTMSNGWVRR